ncbi:hypothetical protein RCL1_004579 [Eukaryota sp. TZLM3-RCL]
MNSNSTSPSNSLTCVIFDLDGTLIDSMKVWLIIDEAFLTKRGLELPHDLHYSICGMSFKETAHYFIKRFSLTESPEAIMDEWKAMAKETYETVPLKDGALEFIQFLASRGIKMGIATSNHRDVLDKLLIRLDISHFFESTRTSCEVKQGKPAPDVFLAVAKDLGVDPSQCAVFEDSPAGVQGAIAAGMIPFVIKDDSYIAEENSMKNLSDGRYFETWYDVIAAFPAYLD